ncbi:MAG: apolipoprotein N-acyltransferase [Elainellaceae cyanobacterium]
MVQSLIFHIQKRFRLGDRPVSILIALLGGLGAGLSPAPTNLWMLAWVALVPLWVLVTKYSKSQQAGDPRYSDRRFYSSFPVLLGLAWGAGYHGLAIFWITGVHPMTWMGVPWLASLAIALFCWIFITAWGAILVGLWAGLFQLLCASTIRFKSMRLLKPTSSPLRRVLVGAALWCGLEALWLLGPLNWSTFAYTQSPTNLIILHVGRLSGPLAVSAALVAVNGLLAEAWLSSRFTRTSPLRKTPQSQRGKRYWAIALLLFAACHGLGFVLYSQPLSLSPQDALKVGVIQGNIPNTIKLYDEGWRRAIEGYTTGYLQLAEQGVDAVLTPETALPTIWTDQTPAQSSFFRAILDREVPVWLGAFGREGNSITNSLFTITGKGETINEYRKVRLVPLGEYIPLQRWIGRLVNRLSPLDAHLVPGALDQHVDTPFGRAIAAICYESAYPDHFRQQAAAGGEFIITASNNAHYSAAMPSQHHAQDVMRSIETDRWAARATNTGYSAFVDAHGRTLWRSDINTYEFHSDTIYRRQTQTPYIRFGNWLTPVLLISALGCRVSETFFERKYAQNF